MTLSEFYEYSWFANMAYVLWSETNTNNREEMRDAANSANRVPGTAEDAFSLGQEIFINQGWTVTNFKEDEGTGFAANIFEKEGTNEKVLAIRGTETDGIRGEQTILDLYFADFLNQKGQSRLIFNTELQQLERKNGRLIFRFLSCLAASRYDKNKPKP